MLEDITHAIERCRPCTADASTVLIHNIVILNIANGKLMIRRSTCLALSYTAGMIIALLFVLFMG